MANSSSSFAAPSQSPKKYDVFISFRGEDTRNNFTSHLHDALCRNKIETYIDYRLEKGDEVWPSLVKAIEDSTLFLIVFSENYASSTWCLNELTKIHECSKDHKEHLVIPVFYKIDPSHVRKQEGSYEIAFSKHEHTSHNQQQIQKWKDALTQAANLSGWHCDAERNEAELIRVIVKGVLIKLDSMYQSDYSNDFIGINQQIPHLESLLCNESQDVRFIGIWGMGGIGKTTIAKALFKKLCFAFESFCFLTNVREELEKHGITYLKSKLFSTLLEDKVSHIGMPNGESPYVLRRLGRKKMLVVLDDVNDPEQLKSLVGVPCWFGKSSRVIITTRDKQVLNKDVDDIYEVKALDFREALQLFCLNAFKHNCLDEEFEQLSKKVVCYAQGIPLALIVLGAFLRGKSKEEWESQLKKLRKMPPKKIQQILKLSYDDLDREEKSIFLDIACFFKGKGVEQVKILLDACGYSTSIGLKSLQDKALVTILGEKVSMHDLIQEMGQQIVCEESLEDPSKRSRLWNPNDIYEILKYNKGSEAIKSITLDMSKIGEMKLSPQAFVKMSKLKFIEFYNSSSQEHSLYIPQGLATLPNEVRYLCWEKYPLKSLPLTFGAENLVELDMKDSNIQKLWHGVQNVVNLRRVELYNSKHLKELPDFSKAIHLEEINLSKCASLCEVHPSILSLERLRGLQLDYCVSLTSLKSDMHFRSLDYVSVRGCIRLKEFSIASENMRYLDLVGTAINEFSSPIACLPKLTSLYLSGCENLNHIPSSLFDGLRCLRELWVADHCDVFELPDKISALSPLHHLAIEGSAIETLPASIKHLSSLEYLSLDKCTRLQSLPEIPPSLRYLKVNDCSTLETVQFTSTAAEPSKRKSNYFDFRNCLKLDQHSIKAILANELVEINKSVSQLEYQKDDWFGTQVVYPGSRVPEWFKYRTTHATSITVDLSSAPLSMDWGLIFCFVVPPLLFDEEMYIDCEAHVRIINDQRVDQGNDYPKGTILNCTARNFTSDHVFLCYSRSICISIHERIKKIRASSNPKVISEIEILCQTWGGMNIGNYVKIKECGICPTYSSEYQNFIKQMELESQTRACEMGIECFDEGEALPPNLKSKGLIFPPLPTVTWRNGIQGLKDIINL